MIVLHYTLDYTYIAGSRANTSRQQSRAQPPAPPESPACFRQRCFPIRPSHRFRPLSNLASSPALATASASVLLRRHMAQGSERPGTVTLSHRPWPRLADLSSHRTPCRPSNKPDQPTRRVSESLSQRSLAPHPNRSSNEPKRKKTQINNAPPKRQFPPPPH